MSTRKHQRMGFNVRDFDFGQMGDGFQVGAFDLFAAPMIDHQSWGDLDPPLSNGLNQPL